MNKSPAFTLLYLLKQLRPLGHVAVRTIDGEQFVFQHQDQEQEVLVTVDEIQHYCVAEDTEDIIPLIKEKLDTHWRE